MNRIQGTRTRGVVALASAGIVLVFGLSQGSTAFAASYSGTAANGFSTPLVIPSSTGLGEPSLAHDDGAGNSGVDRLFAIAPNGVPSIGGGNPSSPLWTSTDGGATWTGPVYDTFCLGAGGGDSDVITDAFDDVYTTDLSLANSCLGVSEPPSPGSSYAAGSPYGSNLQAGDDRPWLAWNKISNQVYVAWDGLNGIHAADSAYEANPALGVQVAGDNIVIPESAINTPLTPDSTRECVCPPGGIAVDNTSGAPNSHSGRIYVSYSYQHGTAISYSDVTGTQCPAPPPPGPPIGTCTGNVTWTGPDGSGRNVVPNSDPNSTGSAFTDEYNFDPIKVDGNGNVYVMWAHAVNFDTTTNVAASVQEYYAYSTSGGSSWSNPILLSTEGGTTTFPTMDVVSPGVLDFAWYGAPQTSDPNTATGPWNLYYERVSNAASNTPTITTAPEVAISGMHNGCIQTGGGAACSDRSLLDFFQLTDTPCAANIIYTGGDVGTGVGTDLYFTKLVTCSNTVVAEAPWAALLLLPGGAAVAMLSRRRIGRRMAA